MSEAPLNQEEQALRRRARRRLVGAIALALLAVVVLPMIFDPEPRPLGGNVEIDIPGQEAPFSAQPTLPAEPVAPETTELAELPPPLESVPPQEQAPAQAPAPKVIQTPQPKAPVTAKPEPIKTESIKPEPIKHAPPKVTPPPPKPAPKVVDKPAEKTPPVKPESVQTAETKATGDFTSRGYFLQLGSFSNENNAQQLAERARAAGINASVVSSAGQNKVRVGPYSEREKALSMQAKLKEKGLKSVLIGP